VRGVSNIADTCFLSRIWYNYILTVLLSTLIDSRIDLRDGITPKAVVIQASETIIFLAGVYQEQYGFLSVHALLPHMVFAATLVQLRRPLGTGDEQQVMPEAGNKRKRLSETETPSGVIPNELSNVASHRSPRRRNPSLASHAAESVLPSWKQHVAAATMIQAGINVDANNGEDDCTVSDYVWPSKPASELAAEGSLQLTKMGIINSKAADLAKALRGRSTARPSAPALATADPPSLWTPGWENVNWGPSSGIDAGLGGLGVDSLEGFSLMTTHPLGRLGEVVPQACPEYVTGDRATCIAGDQGFPTCIEDTSGSSYGGLYIYPNSLPQVECGGSYGGYEPSTVDGVGLGAFAGVTSSQEEGTDDLA
jgi:hypothetical protein